MADVAYGPHPRHVLDLWKAPAAEAAPLLVVFHGGGFRKGDKSGLRPSLLAACLRAGISVAAPNYRLSDTAHSPAFFLDAARSLQFLRHHAGEWSIDPDRIAAAGGSAGAGISLWLGFHDDMAEPASPDPIARHSTRLRCVVTLNGQCSYDPRLFKALGLAPAARHPFMPPFYGLTWEQIDDPSSYPKFDEAAPITYLSADDPPVLMFYRGDNTPLPPDDAPGARVMPTEDNPYPVADRLADVAVHHPRLGEHLKRKMDALGIDAHLHVSVKDDAFMDHETVQFLCRHLPHRKRQ